MVDPSDDLITGFDFYEAKENSKKFQQLTAPNKGAKGGFSFGQEEAS